ncbi:MAG: hypothetical protein AAFR50_01810 [Pseudomonadota bacterium]
MAFRIANHSIRMVWANLDDVLKLTLVPYIVIAFASALLGIAFTGSPTWGGSNFDMAAQVADGGFANEAVSFTETIGSFLNLVIYLVLAAWLAIGWHRFVLAEEYPSGFMPAWNGPRIRSYVGRVVLILVVFFGVSFVAALVVVGLANVSQLVAAPLGIVIVLGITIFYVRISIMLPAISMDRQDFGLKAALEATKPFQLVILGTIAVYALYTIGMVLAMLLVLSIAPFLAMPFQLILEYLLLLVGISTLTTIYGVAVEGRELT